MVNRLRNRYRRSWMGRKTDVTNGRLTLVTAAILGLCVAVPYWVAADSRADRERAAEAEVRAAARNCESSTERAADIKATALAGVEHAEDTAHLMDGIGDVLRSVNAQSPAIVQILGEIDVYVASVAGFRQVAERYQPPTFAQCIAAAQGDETPPPTTNPGG